MTFVKISSPEALTLVQPHSAINLRRVGIFILTLIIHRILCSQHLFPYEILKCTINHMVLLPRIAVVVPLLD